MGEILQVFFALRIGQMTCIFRLCQVNVGNFLTFFLNDILLFFVHLIRL